MSNFAADVPLINEPFVRPDGRVSEAWFMFLIQLFRRTGGTSGNALDDVAIDVVTTPDDPALGILAQALKATNIQVQTAIEDSADKATKADLAAQSIALALVLEEAQDVLSKMRRALQDSTVDQLTPLDPIRSMAYQDASNVKINGGTIDGTPIGQTTAAAAKFTTISASGQITSTVVTGTAPFSIASTTVVPNLNVSQLLGGTWAIPGTIGATTPNTGAFTILTTTSNAAIGTTPSSWGSGFRAIEAGAQGNAYFSATSGNFNSLLTNNAYFDGSNWKYVRSLAATHIEQITGSLKFMTAPSGTAGNNITWTQRLLVDTNGATATALTLTNATPTVSAGQIGFGTTASTTVGAAGGASALPATPVGYLAINVGGTAYKLPYYNS